VARAPQLLQDFHAACLSNVEWASGFYPKNNPKDMFISFQKLYSSIFSLETKLSSLPASPFRDSIPPIPQPQDQMVIPSSVDMLMGQFIASISRQKQLLGLEWSNWWRSVLFFFTGFEWAIGETVLNGLFFEETC